MSDLSELAVQLYDAKKREDSAKKERVAIEEAIAAIVETPENGSKTVEAGDLKVVVKCALSYEADVEAIRDIDATDLPLELIPAEWSFDEKAYEKLRTDNPNLFAAIAKHVTVTPRKVSVTLKLA
jgi:hypothetical protein